MCYEGLAGDAMVAEARRFHSRVKYNRRGPARQNAVEANGRTVEAMARPRGRSDYEGHKDPVSLCMQCWAEDAGVDVLHGFPGQSHRLRKRRRRCG